MKLKCLVVDDEPLSQDVLIKYINETDRLELSGVCNDAMEAGDFIHQQSIDLIFLDINMPRLSGLQFIRSLSDVPMVIFTTAYPEFAVEGFEVDAIDYLVKPFPLSRFLKAVNKAFEKTAKQLTDEEEDVLWLKSDKKLNRINPDNIMYIEATGDYVKLVCQTGSLLVHSTMEAILEKLKNRGFERIHRSYIVSLRRIRYIEGNRVCLDDKFFPLGQSFRDNFLQKLKQ